MQLLYSSGLPATQFASLSLLLKPLDPVNSNNGIQTKDGGIDMVEPMMIAAPTATVSLAQSMNTVRELHTYLTNFLNKAARATSSRSENSVATDFVREDEQALGEGSMQMFRSFGSAGLGLHYRLIHSGTDNTTITKLASLIIASNKNGSGVFKIDHSIGLYGIVICVGITGLQFDHWASLVQHTIAQRISDCLSLLSSSKITENTSAKAILYTYLLSDDEYRKNNDMMRAPDLLIVPEPNDSDSAGGRNLLSPMGIISPIADIGRKTKQLSIQAIRSATVGSAGSTAGEGDEAPSADIGFPLALTLGSAEASRMLIESLHILSVAESDSKLRRYDTSGMERKANIDLMGGAKSRFRRTRKGETRDADFDNFDYKGFTNESVKKSTVTSFKAIPALAPAPALEASSKLTLKSSRKDTTTTRRMAATGSRRLSSQSSDRLDEESVNQQKSTLNTNKSFDPFAGSHHGKGKKSTRYQVEDEHSGPNDASSVSSETHMTVNIALNEDLTCSYKLSQLSSCTVEGFLQVCVKSNARPESLPFLLYVRDAARHIETISENKKIAHDVSHSLTQDDGARYKFVVNVPKYDSYFAVMKYKCIEELRPVPVRVQTKVKTEGNICRVALQISSNPNNAANLTEMTIFMGVPDKVRGETLATQPPGGVWDKGKASVIWCVSELGSGEKFQLQARFEMSKSETNSIDFSFPVLIRCQCLFAQLSDVDVEVRESPDNHTADITTKVARRYRLSHREKYA